MDQTLPTELPPIPEMVQKDSENIEALRAELVGLTHEYWDKVAALGMLKGSRKRDEERVREKARSEAEMQKKSFIVRLLAKPDPSQFFELMTDKAKVDLAEAIKISELEIKSLKGRMGKIEKKLFTPEEIEARRQAAIEKQLEVAAQAGHFKKKKPTDEALIGAEG